MCAYSTDEGKVRFLIRCGVRKVKEGFGAFPPTLLPDRQGEISYVFLAGSSQKAAMSTSRLQHFLGLQACDVSVEPPASTHTHVQRQNTPGMNTTARQYTRKCGG